MPCVAVVEAGYWPPGKHRTLSAHRNPGLEIVLLLRGQVTWHVEGRVEHVSPGSVFFTLPWETHGSVGEREPGCELHYAVVAVRGRGRSFRFDPSLALSAALTRQVRQTLLHSSRRGWPATARLIEVLPALVEERNRQDPLPEVVSALATLAVVELYRSVRGAGTPARLPVAAERVRQLLRRLDDESARPWTLDSMADACALGRTRFSTLLKQLTGDKPRMALNRARVARAQRLLGSTDWSITRIALECGFASSQHFAGVFRAYTGCAARQFRRRQRHRRDGNQPGEG